MTVMIISQTLTGGGAELVAANLSKVLADDNNVIMVTYEQTENEFSYSGERITINSPGNSRSLFGRIITAIKRIYTLRRIKKKYKPDYSISFVPQTDYANVLSFSRGTSSIIEVSSNSSVAFPGGFLKIIRVIVLKLAKKVVAVSEGSRQDLINNFHVKRKKVHTIYNSCDIDSVVSKANSSDIKNIELPPKYIISVGSFRYPKGHWHLIKAFASVADRIPDYSLVILGDGVYRAKYEKLVSELGIEKNRVIMPGFTINPYPIIKSACLFVFPSIYEGFGNVIVESMALGVPVLSTDCKYGPREIIDPRRLNCSIDSFTEGEYGWLFPAFNLDDIDISNTINPNEVEFGAAIVNCLLSEKKRDLYISGGLIRCRDFSSIVFKKTWLEFLNEFE